MNQINKIHLGRQAFTLSIDAQKILNEYLQEISDQLKDKDVVEEIELRIAELLSERGITADKVVLPKDIEHIKKQLGNPADFKEDDTETEESYHKRLFRDTDNGIIAGVAAGLGKYLGLDTLLIRVLFIIFVIITFGWGILFYVLLWLLVPEAKTTSERLQMAGKPVNVRSLKQIVKDADIKGAAKRANSTIADPINSIFRFIVRVVGVVLSVLGLTALFGLIAATVYYLVNSTAWSKNNIFPIGFNEHLLLGIAIGIVALMAVFLTIFGVAIFRRKWPIKSWISGVLIGLVFVGLAATGALIADVYPTVRDAYNSNTHQVVRELPPFSSLVYEGNDSYNINFVQSNKYLVTFDYYGRPNLGSIKTTVNNQILNLNTSSFDPNRNCSTICIPNSYRLNITVYAPNALDLANSFGSIPSPKPVGIPYIP